MIVASISHDEWHTFNFSLFLGHPLWQNVTAINWKWCINPSFYLLIIQILCSNSLLQHIGMKKKAVSELHLLWELLFFSWDAICAPRFYFYVKINGFDYETLGTLWWNFLSWFSCYLFETGQFSFCWSSSTVEQRSGNLGKIVTADNVIAQ